MRLIVYLSDGEQVTHNDGKVEGRHSSLPIDIYNPTLRQMILVEAECESIHIPTNKYSKEREDQNDHTGVDWSQMMG